MSFCLSLCPSIHCSLHPTSFNPSLSLCPSHVPLSVPPSTSLCPSPTPSAPRPSVPPYIRPHVPSPPPSPPCLSVRPQVFLTEYAGPLLIYLLFYFRVPFLYGPRYDFTASRHAVVQCVRGPGGSLRRPGGL